MNIQNGFWALALTLLSGYLDALGFVYAAKIWQKDALVWPMLIRAALGWGFGITLNIFALRYLIRLGVNAAEIQTTFWFAVVIIGVVIFSGKFFTWPRAEQIVAVLVLAGLGWLLYRTGG